MSNFRRNEFSTEDFNIFFKRTGIEPKFFSINIINLLCIMS